MKQLSGLLLVAVLCSFVPPSEKRSAPSSVTSTKQANSNVWFINYSGAANDMTVNFGGTLWNTEYIEPGYGNGHNVIGSFPETSYGFSISKNIPDTTPRYVQIEDPFYQNWPTCYFYWSTGNFYGSFNVTDIFNQISVGFL